MVALRPTLLPLVVIALLNGCVLGVCPCKFQGALLTTAVYDHFPEETPAGCSTCYKAAPPLQWVGANPNTLTVCQGDCDNDGECPGSSVCVQRTSGSPTTIDGCSVGDSGSSARGGTDYCSNPQATSANCTTTDGSATSSTYPCNCNTKTCTTGEKCAWSDKLCVGVAPGCTVNNSVPCTKTPGMYQNKSAIKLYGANCAAWDQMPGTPWYDSCPNNSNWSHADNNWCQQPWCYVDASCPDGVASSVFKGSDVAYYSYKSCGCLDDCYSNIAWNESYVWPTHCPYDPTGAKTYKIHQGGDCACLFQGASLTSAIYDGFPEKTPAGCVSGTNCTKWPGMYAAKAAIKFYGTTCSAWDQMPGTPWYDYCPAGSDWCHYNNNWCQEPWCYVKSACASGVPSSVFKGYTAAAFYSYNTCVNTPDCYTLVSGNLTPSPPTACPFDSSDSNWHTAGQCPTGWTPLTTVTTTTTATVGNTTTAQYVPSRSAHMPEFAAMTMVAIVLAMQH